jgi:hypothetical protein
MSMFQSKSIHHPRNQGVLKPKEQRQSIGMGEEGMNWGDLDQRIKISVRKKKVKRSIIPHDNYS